MQVVFVVQTAQSCIQLIQDLEVRLKYCPAGQIDEHFDEFAANLKPGLQEIHTVAS